MVNLEIETHLGEHNLLPKRVEVRVDWYPSAQHLGELSDILSQLPPPLIEFIAQTFFGKTVKHSNGIYLTPTDLQDFVDSVISKLPQQEDGNFKVKVTCTEMIASCYNNPEKQKRSR